jgi:hypothetical protein
MKFAYFQELKRYSKEDIASALRCPLEEISQVINRLQKTNIIKTVKRDITQKNKVELFIDDLNEQFTSQDNYWVFNYVGIIIVGEYIFKCYPKYVERKSDKEECLKQVLQVIKKYNSQQQHFRILNGQDGQDSFNLLAIILYIIQEYYENGVYTNYKNIKEINGEGEIDWDKTINETDAFIQNGRPYYFDLYTDNAVNDDSDYFKRLHSCIIADCFRRLEKAELKDIFCITDSFSYDAQLSDFGDKEYIQYRIAKELNGQFITKKRNVLNLLATYVGQHESVNKGINIILYGTNNFNLIWEDICKKVFGDQLETPIEQLSMLDKQKNANYSKKTKTLLKLIQKPQWIASGNTKPYKTDTLIPDSVVIYKKDQGLCFGIFDAKYYKIEFDQYNLNGQPGIESITKQYLYQLAYKDFINYFDIDDSTNAFLFPIDGEEVVNMGVVRMEMLSALRLTENKKLSNILAIKLPAKKMYHWYLHKKVINIYEVIGI